MSEISDNTITSGTRSGFKRFFNSFFANVTSYFHPVGAFVSQFFLPIRSIVFLICMQLDLWKMKLGLLFNFQVAYINGIRFDIPFNDNPDADDVSGISDADDEIGISDADDVNGISGADDVNGNSDVDNVNNDLDADNVNVHFEADDEIGNSDANNLNGNSGVANVNNDPDADDVNGVSDADNVNGNSDTDNVNGVSDVVNINNDPDAINNSVPSVSGVDDHANIFQRIIASMTFNGYRFFIYFSSISYFLTVAVLCLGLDVVAESINGFLEKSNQSLKSMTLESNIHFYRIRKLAFNSYQPKLGQKFVALNVFGVHSLRLFLETRRDTIPSFNRNFENVSKEFKELELQVIFPEPYIERYSPSFSGHHFKRKNRRVSAYCKIFSYYKAYKNVSKFVWDILIRSYAARKEFLRQDDLLKGLFEEVCALIYSGDTGSSKANDLFEHKKTVLFGRFLDQYIKCISSYNNWRSEWNQIVKIFKGTKIHLREPKFLLPLEDLV